MCQQYMLDFGKIQIIFHHMVKSIRSKIHQNLIILVTEANVIKSHIPFDLGQLQSYFSLLLFFLLGQQGENTPHGRKR